MVSKIFGSARVLPGVPYCRWSEAGLPWLRTRPASRSGPGTDGASTTFRTVLAGTIAVLVGVQLYPLLLWSPLELTARDVLFDDAFFYSVLARNYWRFGFLTFDGEMATNGVQPLWMWAQILLAGVFPHIETATLLVRSTWVTYVAFSFLTIWFVARGSVVAASVRSLLVSALVLLNVRVQSIVVQGLETSLFLFVLVVTLLMCDAWLGVEPGQSRQELSRARVAILAGAAACCFLARTDFFWIFIIIAIWLALRVQRAGQALLTFAIVGGVLIAPYLVENEWAHGALMPISGRVKLFYLNSFLPDRPSYLSSDEWRALFQALPSVIRLPKSVPMSIRVVVTLALLAAGGVVVWRLRRTRQLRTSLVVLSWAVLGHLLFMHLVYRELREYASYYFVPEIWWLAISIAFWLSPLTRQQESMPGSAPRVRTAVAAMAALGVVSAAGWGWPMPKFEPSSYWGERLKLADDIRRLPKDARIGAFWPGCLASFSGRDIAPLDGIVGSNDYFQKYVKGGREFDYVREHRIDYVAIFLTEPPAVLLSRSEPPRISYWSELGVRRLWENRNIPVTVAAKRAVADDVGWYLLRLGG
jgi:hypothetical protein